MNNTIIIIESPNKVEKIAKYSGAQVYATKGHFKTLADNFLKDYENYEPIFEYIESKKFPISKIIDNCKNKDVIIATDPDREGFGIGYMFYDLIKNIAKSVKRAEFHEITQMGIQKGLDNAIPFKSANLNEFEAFKARSVGDKLVGFILSPKYINKLGDKNVAVGRVQTPALNMIVQREKEIEEFNNNSANKQVSYKIKVKLSKDNQEFYAINDNIYESKEEIEAKINSLKDIKQALVYKIDEKDIQIKPKEPFRTSQYQEEANKKFGFSSEVAMSLAQKLFEKGLITYHRTDSNILSNEFIDEVGVKFGSFDWYEKREYQAGKQSQAQAHEAIRISHIHDYEDIENKIAKEEKLSDDEIKVYKLIYTNSLLSQSKNAINKSYSYDIDIDMLSFKAKATKEIYKGFKGVFENFSDDKEINEDEKEEQTTLILDKNEKLDIIDYEISEVKKQAPKRYKESNFISILEKNGIGRPSTYATFLPRLLQRDFIKIEAKGKNQEIIATTKGIRAIESMIENQDDWITKSEFTAHMEAILDEISQGKLSYLDFIKPLHEKMEFNPISTNENQVKIPPSPKSLEYAKNLAQSTGLEIPSQAYEDYKICKEFIDKAKALKPPTQKQIELVEKIAKSNNIELPKNYQTSVEICSKFINKHLKKNK
ncbi:type IA DNA topoisomerase [Campylobacter lanienae]|uniref:type IA DNA topoisomerase n=1 Tax=Campylobacter lanienae TaxID=75658 RepID=UPI000BB3E86F|nr:type IA DNA topoisomerase [Campylobacter lanienae]